MIGVFLLAWVVFGALMLVLSAGAGLLVRRLAGPAAVPVVLVLPLGLASFVVLAGLLCYFAPLAPLAAPACALLGVVGLIAGRRQLGSARHLKGSALWALVAALGAWLVIAAPVLFTGKPGFTGYARIVDTSYEFDLAAHFAHTGRSIPGTISSAYQAVIAKYLGSGYPGGGQWTLGALSNLMPVDLSWLYQPFLAFLTAMCALSLYSLLGRLIESRPLRALGALVAAQPNVLVAYVLGGGIKELSTICFLLLTAATLAAVLPRLEPGRRAIPATIALAATVASFSLTTLPWIGVLGVGTCLTVIALQRQRVRALAGSAQIALGAIVLSAPTLAAALKLLPVVSGSGPVDLGNLSTPVPAITAAGVWIGGDIRYTQYAHRTPSEALAIVVLVMAACGVAFAVRRRAWAVVWLGAAGAVALYYVAHRYGPWIQFKADCISSPIALLLAFAGVGALVRVRRLRPVGLLAGVAIAAGVLAGNALLYHDTSLAPYERLHNLEYIGQRFAGQGPTLTPDFEEYAEYYLRDADQTSMVTGPTLGLRPGVNRAAEPGGIFAYDLNEFAPSWIESFRTIVMRRDPLASRPPSNYRLAYLSDYYEVWQRTAPASTVYAHLAVTDGPGHASADADAAVCADAMRSAHKAGPHARIAYMPAPSHYIQFDSSDMVLRGGLSNGGGAIIGIGAGSAVREQRVPLAGRYDLYMGGSIGRPVSVIVDGRQVAQDAYQESYPYQWLLIGSVWLSRGTHRIEITRGGFGLHPGNGDGIDGFNRTIGPLDLMPAQPAVPSVRYSSVSQFGRTCRSLSLRWIEVVRG